MKNLTAFLYCLMMAMYISCSSPTSTSEDYQNLSEEERFEIAKQIAHNTIIVDGHVDLPYRMRVGGFTLQREILNVADRTEGGNFDFPRSEEGGLDAPFMSIYIPARYQETGGAKVLADSLIQMTKRIAITWPEKFALAYSPQDIQNNFEMGKSSLPLGMENGAPIEGDIENLEYFYNQGIRYITLTHGKDNLIGDSSYDTTYTHGGLSEFGVLVVKEMNRLGIMVDVSHVSDETFYDVMEKSRAPVIASHSSARHFTPGFERNMDDGMIKKLAENGGVIMINFGDNFIDQSFGEKDNKVNEHIVNWLSENSLKRSDPEAETYIEKYVQDNNPFPFVEKVADHIDHVLSLAEIDHIGLGSSRRYPANWS